MNRRRSLVARLMFVQIAALAGVWLLVIVATIVSMYQRGAGDIDVELGAAASGLARLTPDGASAAEAARTGAELAAINRENSDPPLQPGEFAYQIWNAEGRLLARSGEQPPLPNFAPGVSPDERDTQPAGWYTRAAWNGSHRIYAVAAKRAGYYQRRARTTSLELAALWLVLAALSAAAFWVSFRFVIRPVRDLADRVAIRAADDLRPVDDAGVFDEIRPLVAALNQKLARLRVLLEAERRFFADAAHELRTPLSAIGAQAHVLAHEPELAQRVLALRQIEAGIERGARAVSKLLALGKLAGAETQLARTNCDVTAIAATVIDANRARAIQRGQNLKLIGSGADCAGDAEQIAVLIANLLENAIQYCPPGSTIEVTVDHGSGHVLIRVADDGPGIAPADRERVFDRFERLSATDTQGSGLGLAIVRRIAVLHGGDATAGAGLRGRGTTIEVRIPQGR